MPSTPSDRSGDGKRERTSLHSRRKNLPMT